MQLREISGSFAILRYPATEPVPSWVAKSVFYSVSKTPDELSIVCEVGVVQPGAEKCEDGWRCFRVEGSLDFALTGILARIANPLAQAEVSIFAVSTFDTDYVLVKAALFEKAQASLREAGFTFLKP